MNVTITMDAAEAQEKIDTAMQEMVESLTAELDSTFRAKIDSPEQVKQVYSQLEKYEELTGEAYEITFEENTIV